MVAAVGGVSGDAPRSSLYRSSRVTPFRHPRKHGAHGNAGAQAAQPPVQLDDARHAAHAPTKHAAASEHCASRNGTHSVSHFCAARPRLGGLASAAVAISPVLAFSTHWTSHRSNVIDAAVVAVGCPLVVLVAVAVAVTAGTVAAGWMAGSVVALIALVVVCGYRRCMASVITAISKHIIALASGSKSPRSFSPSDHGTN